MSPRTARPASTYPEIAPGLSHSSSGEPTPAFPTTANGDADSRPVGADEDPAKVGLLEKELASRLAVGGDDDVSICGLEVGLRVGFLVARVGFVVGLRDLLGPIVGARVLSGRYSTAAVGDRLGLYDGPNTMTVGDGDGSTEGCSDDGISVGNGEGHTVGRAVLGADDGVAVSIVGLELG